jgi:ubiquinone/menaquinone biosynthesis C-methylase UbiE/uncharacterized protein YbaR (Trm112 family)
MHPNHDFVCPATHDPLELVISRREGNSVLEGELRSAGGAVYPVRDCLPWLLHPPELPGADAESQAWYDANHASYDENLPLTFRTFGLDETALRSRLVDLLALQPGHKVLETGAGTGRDSAQIAARLGAAGELHVHDLHAGMLSHAVARLAGARPRVVFGISNAAYLPYPDAHFDAYYHFGGFNTFSDRKRAFAEISRVVKPGGRVVVGDESMAPWLRGTEYGAILMNSNPHYRYAPPLADLHISAREVTLRYIAGNAYYAIDYTVGSGMLQADFDFEIPGPRGGTLRTRMYGQIEGVSAEAVQLARAARERSGKSMHRWLDEAIRRAAAEDLGNAG